MCWRGFFLYTPNSFLLLRTITISFNLQGRILNFILLNSAILRVSCAPSYGRFRTDRKLFIVLYIIFITQIPIVVFILKAVKARNPLPRPKRRFLLYTFFISCLTFLSTSYYLASYRLAKCLVSFLSTLRIPSIWIHIRTFWSMLILPAVVILGLSFIVLTVTKSCTI